MLLHPDQHQGPLGDASAYHAIPLNLHIEVFAPLDVCCGDRHVFRNVFGSQHRQPCVNASNQGHAHGVGYRMKSRGKGCRGLELRGNQDRLFPAKHIISGNAEEITQHY